MKLFSINSAPAAFFAIESL